MNLVGDGAIPSLESALRFAWQRHEVILNNIANVSTPGYRAQDLPVREFQATLGRLRARTASPTVLGGNPQPLPAAGRAAFSTRFVPRPTADLPGPDGNSVVAETEAAKLARNAAQFTAMAQLLTRQFDLIEKAIRERV
ncbi:MAG: flagellar basal body rod protein FlgB [Candidatus Brocadiae bacterium]|nr:flagellar basal body rod protein FlgB [Candidatus Brocadiia bacterium]